MPTTVGACPLYRRSRRVLPTLSRISTGRWRSRSASDAERYDRTRPRYPDAHGGADRRRQPRARRPRRRLRHRHRRPAVPGGRLQGTRGRARRADGRLRAADRGRGRGGDVRNLGRAGRSLRRGHRRDSLALGGPGRRSGQGSAGAAARRPAGLSATCFIPARGGGSLRQGLPAGGARLAVQPPGWRGRPWTRTRRCSPRSPTGSGRWAASATRSSGDSTGSSPTPGTRGWIRCPPTVPSPSSRRTSWRRCWTGVGAAIDAMGGSFTMHYATVAVTAARTSAS